MNDRTIKWIRWGMLGVLVVAAALYLLVTLVDYSIQQSVTKTTKHWLTFYAPKVVEQLPRTKHGAYYVPNIYGQKAENRMGNEVYQDTLTAVDLFPNSPPFRLVITAYTPAAHQVYLSAIMTYQGLFDAIRETSFDIPVQAPEFKHATGAAQY